MADKPNGKALQLIHSGLMALLIGICGWIGNTVIKSREDIIKLRTELDLMNKSGQEQRENQIKNQQDILKVLKDILDAKQ